MLFKMILIANLGYRQNPTNIPTIVFFGSMGVGKSSVINMLPDDPHRASAPARTSLSGVGVTSQTEAYHKIIVDQPYRVFDTPGLGELSEGTVPTDKAIEMLYDVLLSESVINLLVLVVRAGRMDAMGKNNILIMQLLAGLNIPLVIVFTHADQLDNTDEHLTWWTNQPATLQKQFPCIDHVCVSAKKGATCLDGSSVYDLTRTRLVHMISRTASHPGFRVNPRSDGQVVSFLNNVRRLLGKPNASDVEFCEALRNLLLPYGIVGRKADQVAVKIANQRPHLSSTGHQAPQTSPPQHAQLAVPRTPDLSSTVSDPAGFTHIPTIVLFGPTGGGKSAVINMLPNDPQYADDVARSDNTATGVTTAANIYHKVIGQQLYRVIDTPGTGEPSDGTTPTGLAVKIFYDVLISTPVINLVVLVIRAGGLTQMAEMDLQIIRLLAGDNVPVVIVFTHIDEERTEIDHASWWVTRPQGVRDRFPCAAHACVCASRGRGDDQFHIDLYNKTRANLLSMIANSVARPGFRVLPLQIGSRDRSFLRKLKNLLPY